MDLNKFKADLLESIEIKLRSICSMSDYYENNLQEFNHKCSICESVRQLSSAENTDKVIRYETHLQRSIEKNFCILRSLQGLVCLSFTRYGENRFYFLLTNEIFFNLIIPSDGVVAQLEEHHNGIVGVVGSNPINSTILIF